MRKRKEYFEYEEHKYQYFTWFMDAFKQSYRVSGMDKLHAL